MEFGGGGHSGGHDQGIGGSSFLRLDEPVDAAPSSPQVVHPPAYDIPGPRDRPQLGTTTRGTMILRRPLLPTLSLLAALSLACAKSGPPPTPYAPNFAFEPTMSRAGEGISIGLVNPKITDAVYTSLVMQYAKMGVTLAPGAGEPPEYQAFREAVGRGLVGYFTGSGFTVSGPFKSTDEMTFPEKKQADLVLTVDFGVLADQPTPALVRDNAGKVVYASSSGNCTVTGAVSFVLWEPLSMQRMWAKSVDVPPSSFDCTIPTMQASSFDVLIRNGFNRAYEQIFTNTLQTAVRYFNPEEVALIKKQALELRANKVY